MNIACTFILYNFLILGYYFGVKSGVKSKRKNQSVLYLIMACLLCGIVAAFRGDCGSDTNMYMRLYYGGVDAIHRWESFESGYILLMNLFKVFKLPFEAFLFFIGSSTTYLITRFIKDNAEDVDLSVICLAYTTDLYFFGFNGIRQMIAICICVYAINLIFRNKLKTSVLLIIAAMFFHRSAGIVLLIIFLKQVLKHRKLYKFFTVCGIMAILFFVNNRDILGNLVYYITKSDYYQSYFTRNAYVDSNLLTYFIKQVPILFIAYFGLMHRTLCKEKARLYYSLALFGIVFSSIGAITQTQIARLGMYFSTFKIYVYGYASKNRLYITHNKYLRETTIKKIVITYLYALFFYNYFIKGFSEIVPYGLFKGL